MTTMELETSPNLLRGREKEQLFLENLFKMNLPVTTCLVLNGPSGCGKSRLVSNTLCELERLYDQKWILINCLEGCPSSSHGLVSGICPRLMFELILQSMKLRYVPHSSVSCRCDGTPRFLEQLCELLMEVSMHSSDREAPMSMIVVFDQADKLRDADPLLLPLLVRLGSLVEDELRRNKSLIRTISLTTVLITRSPWEKFSNQTFHLEPVVMPISSYTRDQIMSILLSMSPPGADSKRFARFVDLLLTVCFPVCRNAGEMIYLMQTNWLAFEEPVKKGLVAPNDEWTQWKLAQPTLKRSLANLYLRNQSNIESKTSSTPYNSSALELPYFTRYLLIAAFMASYNPRTADKKFLVKNSEKQSIRKKRQEKTNDKTNALLNGPQAFPLDRLLAIFHALLRDESTPVPTSSLLLSQIACLTALGLLSATTPANAIGGFLTTGFGAVTTGQSQTETDPLSNPRYRCLLSFETARAVAKSLDFDLPAYLTDFYGT